MNNRKANQPLATSLAQLKRIEGHQEEYQALCEKLGGVQEFGEYTPLPYSRLFDLAGEEYCKAALMHGDEKAQRALQCWALLRSEDHPPAGADAEGLPSPGKQRDKGSIWELLASPKFNEAPSPLTIALGKDPNGNPEMGDLIQMLQLLVAGADSAEINMCLDSVLLSLLSKASPDDLRILLIDLSNNEFGLYAELPHLVHPVVTEISQAKDALDWLLHE